MTVTVRLQAAPFDPGAETNAFLADCAGMGAAVSFTGMVRSSPDDPISSLTLEHYAQLAETQLIKMGRQAAARFTLAKVTIIHRYGKMLPGEPIVQVMALSPHRQAAFDGANFIMDYLKTDAPFWKQEDSGAGRRWVEAKSADDDARDKWNNK